MAPRNEPRGDGAEIPAAADREGLEAWVRLRRNEAAQQGEPAPPRPPLRRRPRLVVAGIVAVVGLLLAGLLGWQAHRERMGLASVSGFVVDRQGHPLEGVLVFTTTAPGEGSKTDRSGSFSLRDLPPGRCTLVVVRGRIGQEFRVILAPRRQHDIGTCRYEAPPAP